MYRSEVVWGRGSTKRGNPIFLISIANFSIFLKFDVFSVENDGLGYSYDISIVKLGKKHFKMDFMGRANLAPLGKIPKKIP